MSAIMRVQWIDFLVLASIAVVICLHFTPQWRAAGDKVLHYAPAYFVVAFAGVNYDNGIVMTASCLVPIAVWVRLYADQRADRSADEAD